MVPTQPGCGAQRRWQTWQGVSEQTWCDVIPDGLRPDPAIQAAQPPRQYRSRPVCILRGNCEPPSGPGGCFAVAFVGYRPATSENCSGCGRNPRCIGAGRSTSVRTAPARPAQPAAVRCVRTLFAHMLKRPGPPAPAPKEFAVLPPWPAAASTDRHRQKYSLWFKAPSAVQTRPAVPLGSHSCLSCPHSFAVRPRQSPVRPGVKTAFPARPGQAGAVPADGWQKSPAPASPGDFAAKPGFFKKYLPHAPAFAKTFRLFSNLFKKFCRFFSAALLPFSPKTAGFPHFWPHFEPQNPENQSFFKKTKKLFKKC